MNIYMYFMIRDETHIKHFMVYCFIKFLIVSFHSRCLVKPILIWIIICYSVYGQLEMIYDVIKSFGDDQAPSCYDIGT